MAQKQLKWIPVVGILLGLVTTLADQIKANAEFTFTVENKSSRAVTQVLVSEDGREWGYFSLNETIRPGKTGTMTWGEHTNNEACVQWIKIGYEDGTMTEPAEFDFCKNPDLQVED